MARDQTQSLHVYFDATIQAETPRESVRANLKADHEESITSFYRMRYRITIR